MAVGLRASIIRCSMNRDAFTEEWLEARRPNRRRLWIVLIALVLAASLSILGFSLWASANKPQMGFKCTTPSPPGSINYC